MLGLHLYQLDWATGREFSMPGRIINYTARSTLRSVAISSFGLGIQWKEPLAVQ